MIFLRDGDVAAIAARPAPRRTEVMKNHQADGTLPVLSKVIFDMCLLNHIMCIYIYNYMISSYY